MQTGCISTVSAESERHLAGREHEMVQRTRGDVVDHRCHAGIEVVNPAAGKGPVQEIRLEHVDHVAGEGGGRCVAAAVSTNAALIASM